ncbi:MAG TPA: hypothetical protein VGK87_13170 [Anaerolineae bacterium]|jgi:hypothetical protein
MIRLFDIRDVATVQRLSTAGRPLAYEPVAVDGLNPLLDAMRAYISGGYDHAITLVRRDPNSRELDAFGLMYIIPGRNARSSELKHAAMIVMSPAPHSDAISTAWTELAEVFVAQAGEHGVDSITAEVSEEGRESEALQRVGFSSLIHQDIMKLGALPEQMDASDVIGLNPQGPADDLSLRNLNLRVVPRFLQNADAGTDLTRLTHHADCGFVLTRNQEVMAHVSLQQGRRGVGMQVLFRHEAEDMAQPALQYVLANLCDKTRRPVYCMVPSYQSWLLPILDTLGFVHVTSNMIMVKHTTARVRQPVWSVQPSQVHTNLIKGDTKIHHHIPHDMK